VIIRGCTPPPPVINTESVILQNAPHSQHLPAMGRIAFLWGGWTLQNKFAKTGEIKGDTYLHGVRYDNKKFLSFIVIRYLLLKYFVL
jgi:hypothetical protein